MIAKKAIAKNTGARGLRAILESILTEAMYEVLRLKKYPSQYINEIFKCSLMRLTYFYSQIFRFLMLRLESKE